MIHPPTIFKQQLGDCFVHPPCTAFQVLLQRAGKEVWTPSRRFIMAIWCNGRRSQSLPSALDIVKRYGFCREELYPYDPSGLTSAEFYAYPPPEVISAAKPFAGVKVRKPSGLRDVSKWLEQGFPVMFSFACNPDDLSGPMGKHAEYIKPRHYTPYYHAATILGRTGDRVTVLNSYGEKWGDGGKFSMRTKDVTDKGRNFHVMTELP